MLRKIPVIQGSRRGMVLVEISPGNFLPRSPQKDNSTSRERRRDVNDYVVGWFDVDGRSMQVAYVEHQRPEDNEILIQANESTYIPAGQKHRLENPGIIPCVMIEVQCGAYLGEDDIVRFDDKYGR